DAKLAPHRGLRLKMGGFAMDRHQKAWPRPRVELAQLLPARMPRDVHKSVAIGDDPDAAIHELVLDVDHRALVARNGPGREDHDIAGREVDDGMLAGRDAGNGRARLALAARADKDTVLA